MCPLFITVIYTQKNNGLCGCSLVCIDEKVTGDPNERNITGPLNRNHPGIKNTLTAVL